VNLSVDNREIAARQFGAAKEAPEEYPGARRVLHLFAAEDGHSAASGLHWDEVTPLAQFEPTLILEDDFLRPLCDALVHYFTGTEDTRQLRRDYDAERKRTDVLIDHLAAVTRSLAEPQP
jgi:hypothetical protein